MPIHDYNKDFRHDQLVHYNGVNRREVVERLQEAYDC